MSFFLLLTIGPFLHADDGVFARQGGQVVTQKSRVVDINPGDHRHQGVHLAQLELDPQPGRAPDQHSHCIEKEISHLFSFCYSLRRSIIASTSRPVGIARTMVIKARPREKGQPIEVTVFAISAKANGR